MIQPIELTPKTNNFIETPIEDSLTEIINFMVKYSVISVDLNDIYTGRKNHLKFFLSLINCLCLWMTLLSTIMFIKFDQLKMLLANPLVPYEQLDFIGFLFIAYYSLVSAFKTDLLIEEYKNNLSQIKFLYYLTRNIKSIHKLTNFNYKKFHRNIHFLNFILLKISFPVVVWSVLIALFTIVIFTESIFIKLLYPFAVYSTITFNTTSYSSLPLIYSMLYYYQLRFNQITSQFQIFIKRNIISPLKFINLIEEHNQISIEIHKMNLLMKKSVALVFITSSMAIDFLIYLSFYSQSIFYRIFFQFFAILICLIYISLIVNIIKVSNSAHQCYHLICSLVIQRKLSYRIKFKVKLK